MHLISKITKNKYLLTSLVFSSVLFLTSNFNYTFAYSCGGLDYTNPDSLSLPHMICPVIQVINFLLFSAGAVLIGMILLGAYKYATSVGDIKGIDGAKQTLTYAFIGFAIVVGTYTFLNIVGTTFGISRNYASGDGVFTSAQSSMCKFLIDNGIVKTTPPGC
jgi:hypothetical protein